ncbi:MAG: hypothetical protein HY960_09500 [Ignavibacteriae bacterium]|nr:hypothetical protein [Ignavibacteriota bacterium]
MKLTRHTLFFLLMAFNYFAYQVELFEEEHKEKYRELSSVVSFASFGVTWESFGKTSAQKAFVYLVDVQITLLGLLPKEDISNLHTHPPFELIRDKSPPSYYLHKI